jgi:hypothetical protein
MSETQAGEPGTGDSTPKKDMLLVQNSAGHLAVMPRSIDEIWRLATLMVKSKMCPHSFKDDPTSITIAIAWGMEIGLSAMQAIQGIAIINNRPAIWGDTMVAVMLIHPEYDSHDEEIVRDQDGNAIGARYTVRRKKGGKVASLTREFFRADALAAGLLSKDTYKAYPADMFLSKARSRAIRGLFADALRGMGSADELIDVVPQQEPQRVVATAEPIRQPQRKVVVAADMAAEPSQVVAVVFEDGNKVIAVDTGAGEVLMPTAAAVAIPDAIAQSLADLDDFEAPMRSGLSMEEVGTLIVDGLNAAETVSTERGAVILESKDGRETLFGDSITVATQTAQEPEQATLIPPATVAKPTPVAAKPATDAKPGKLSAGMRDALGTAIFEKARTTTWQDLIDELGGEPTAATFARALAWIEARPDA